MANKKNATKKTQTKPTKVGTAKKKGKTSTGNKSNRAGKSTKKTTNEAWDASKAFIVYRQTGETVEFDNIEDAEKHYKKLLLSQRALCDVKTFETEAEFKALKENIVVQDSSDESDENVQTEARKPPAVTPERALPKLNRSTNSSSTTAVGASLSVAQKSRHIYAALQKSIPQTGASFKIHYFPNTPDLAKGSIVFLEFVDKRSDFNHWLHKPDAYEHMLEADEALEPDQQMFPKNMYGLKSSCLRNTVYTDEYTPKTQEKVMASNKSTYTIKAMGLYFVVPLGLSDDALKTYIHEMWTKVVSSPDIPDVYLFTLQTMGVSTTVQNALKNKQNSPYWNQLRGSLNPKKMAMVKHYTLDEIFLRPDLDNIMSTIFDIPMDDVTQGIYSEDEAAQHTMYHFGFKD